MEECIDACRILFQVPQGIAKRLLPLLTTDDVRIAAVRTVQNQVPAGVDLDAPQHRMYRTTVIKVSRARGQLLEYVREHQKRQVCLMQEALPTDEQTFYEGSIIPTEMRFGSYLYYRGVISREMLDRALAWQKGKRPLMGQIALWWGYISPTDFAHVLCSMRTNEMFGDAARRMGKLSEAQLKMILEEQKRFNCRIGTYFILNSILAPTALKDYLHQMKEHNRRYAV
jgi:hypothetical protein